MDRIQLEKFWWPPYSSLRRYCISLSCTQYPMLHISFFALRNVLCLFYPFGLFTKVPQVPHPLQNQQALRKEVLERIFSSSSLNTVFFVGEPLLKNSLSLALHLLPFSSPYIRDLPKCTRGILYNPVENVGSNLIARPEGIVFYSGVFSFPRCM